MSGLRRHLPQHLRTVVYVQATSRQAGSAAAGAELKKQQKYQDLSVGVDFVPVAIETFGV